MKFRQLLIGVLFCCGCTALTANGYQNSYKIRDGKSELSFKLNYLDSQTVDGQSGSFIDLNSDMGWGFEFGHNFTEHFNFSFEFTNNRIGYDAVIIPDEPNPTPINVSSKVDMYNSQFNFTYNFMKGDFTPYAGAGIGWAYIDSNVSTGPPTNVCWWDPWWGYVCDTFIDTYSDYNFSYNARVGLRWDINRRVYSTVSWSPIWIDFDNASTADFNAFKLEIGTKF